MSVSLQQVKARGNVENWLGLVEDSMVVSLRKLTKAALADFEEKPRHVWATQHASQVYSLFNIHICMPVCVGVCLLWFCIYVHVHTCTYVKPHL